MARTAGHPVSLLLLLAFQSIKCYSSTLAKLTFLQRSYNGQTNGQTTRFLELGAANKGEAIQKCLSFEHCPKGEGVVQPKQLTVVQSH